MKARWTRSERTHTLTLGFNICILINVVVPKVEYAGEVWEGNAKSVKQLETVQMTSKVLGSSSTTSNTVLRAELGMHPLKTTKRREQVGMAI